MTMLVTGVAGFVGSHLAEGLLHAGHLVRGVDCLTTYYDPRMKNANLKGLLAHPDFQFVEADLLTCDLGPLLEDIRVVFHQAGQPGVRLSWSDGFHQYEERNVLLTQRLLEAVKDRPLRRFVYASSSSVYGNAPSYPTSESDLPCPHSPYGVTKLAAEHLCHLYASNWGVPALALRYFTVYGPRQRPDMALHRFIESALDDKPLPVFGTGEQLRDFTYVDDVVAANVASIDREVPPGTVINIAGGSSTTVRALLGLLEGLIARRLRIQHLPEQRGDVARTAGSTERAREMLDWRPRVELREGLSRQLAWHRERRELEVATLTQS